MSAYSLIESRTERVSLSDAEAASLRELGRRLAGDSLFWAEEESAQRSAISCARADEGVYEVRVDNAIGAIAVGDVVLTIGPKIPFEHFLLLAEKSGRIPRVDPALASTREGFSFWHLVARAFIGEAERVFDRDLAKDYVETSGAERFARGQVDLASTVIGWYTHARADIVCRYEDFEADTPLNRLLKEAALAVAGSAVLPWDLRRRGLTVADRMDGVGEFRQSDYCADTDRRTAYYETAADLARNVIRGVGRAPQVGSARTWSFLLPTPLVVEDGIRRLLHERLPSGCRPAARGGCRRLEGSPMTINPDLVFPACDAVGDVKYKISDGGWNRGDLYQSVAFAAGYEVSRSIIVGFRRTAALRTSIVKVGAIRIHQLLWDASDETSAEDSAARLVADTHAVIEAHSTTDAHVTAETV